MIKRKQVSEAIRAAIKVIAEWEASSEPTVNWRGVATKALSRTAENKLRELFQFCTETNIADDAKEIILALDRVHTEFVAFDQACDIAPETVHPSGTPELRSAIRALSDAIIERPVRLPENIRDLMESGVPDEQICKIYGFLTADRAPDMTKLSEEKRKPGTHFDPETWQPPSEQRRLAEINEQWAKRKPAEVATINPDVEQSRPIAPEPLEDLIAQGVSPEQIAHMKGISIEDVEAFAMQNGLPLEGRVIRDTSDEGKEKSQAELAKRRADLIPRSHPEINDMEDRILACAIDGMKPVDIADALQLDFPDLSWQKVSALIRKFEKEGEENAA